MENHTNLISPREINRFSLKSHTSPLFQLRWVQLSAGGAYFSKNSKYTDL
ncbi:MAG: hypothetical protein NTZ83_00925 [Candidatus Pacearchaeota archaeon]|nr:hypothetical protein [Candidatus Pacearchaeota archaeon]